MKMDFFNQEFIDLVSQFTFEDVDSRDPIEGFWRVFRKSENKIYGLLKKKLEFILVQEETVSVEEIRHITLRWSKERIIRIPRVEWVRFSSDLKNISSLMQGIEALGTNKNLSSIRLSTSSSNEPHILLVFSSVHLSKNNIRKERKDDFFEFISNTIRLFYLNVCFFSNEMEAYKNSLNSFQQDLTHQLVGPISGMRAYLSNILSGNFSYERSAQYLQKVFQIAGLIQYYAESNSLVSSLTRGLTTTWTPERFDGVKLLELILRVEAYFQGLLLEKHIKVGVARETFIGLPELMLDNYLFEILLMNLVDNGIKYSYSDTPIRVFAQTKLLTVELHFTSYGIQISKTDTERIFQKGYRSRDAIKEFSTGAGIGLYLCKEIARIHSGEIRVDPSKKSIYGNEVTFVVTLPIHKQ